MDIATIIGIVAGFGLILGSIAIGGPLSSFIDIPSALIVAGGTVAATLIANRLKVVINAVKVASNAFRDKGGDVAQVSAQLQSLADKARKDGLLALENEKVEDPFLGRAVRLAVDGVPPEVIKDMLVNEMTELNARHRMGHETFKFMGATAPSMGMIGTLIGLVQMLQTLDDPSSIGPSMAVALLTTMYGAVLAFLVFNPIADKLSARTKTEVMVMRIIIEGIEAMVRGDNAMILKEKLEGYLPPKVRPKPEAEG